VQGKAETIHLAVVAALAQGHLLLEDRPGIGKTTLAHTLARALGLGFRRVQFTSDLLPSDLLGVSVYEATAQRFHFRPGPLFAHVVLADEINRSPPKVQSALLEAMSERQVSVDGETHALPRPFLVMATQNPHEHAGTYVLPYSQLDRFLMRLSMGYPGREAERSVLRARGYRDVEVAPALEQGALERLLSAVDEVDMHIEVEDYLLDLVDATRAHPDILHGVSPRGSEALHRACRALALADGRDYCVPEDVHDLAVPVLAHRIVPRQPAPGADIEAITRVLQAALPPR